MRAELVIRNLPRDRRQAVERLEALDEGRLPDGELLVAEVDGELWAAVAIESGSGIADPFRPSGKVLAALQATAESLHAVPRSQHRRNPVRRARVRRLRGRYLSRGGASALQPVHRA